MLLPSLRLLLIDDDELDRMAVMRALRRSQLMVDVVQATTAAEGIALAAEQEFDAILLDYRLPDQDGIEVLRALRSDRSKGVAVLMLSRQEDEALAELCLDAGAQDFLLKDEVNTRRLLRAVRQARQRYQMEVALNDSREMLQQLSELDALTGLTNRRGFEHALVNAIARAQRGDGHLAVLLLDLDDFKMVNDSWGHDAGDALLIEVAKRLSSTIRDGDRLCRLGGDEFVVLMVDFADEKQAVLLADRLVAALQTPVSLGVTNHVVTTSIGIATLKTCADNGLDLLRFADIAMYQAKQDGRNQSRFYSAALQEAVQLRAGIKHDLQSALANNEFEIYYQAQVNAIDGSLGGMEALLRWRHPRLGLLTPATFMTVAEETGLIVGIGDWVIHTACRQLGTWQARHPMHCPKLALGINLSAVQVRHEHLFDVIKSALSLCSLDAGSLELELTESALITDASETIAMLSKIVREGISLSLDDFGTGYSSLEHLKLFPISVLKIDKGFVSAIGSDAKGERLLVAIIAFAKALEMKVVAEGVETRAQADFCTKNGCDLLQGYHFSYPVSADEFEATFLL
jgi:diguanylate cyclase (GGDEF)-like protein